MFFNRIAGLLNRSLISTLTKPVYGYNVLLKGQPPMITVMPALTAAGHEPQLTQIRTFRDKDILKLRCNACYFKKLDNRWWVLCTKHPRHKQRQKVEDVRMSWIVTHITRTGSYLKKHFQYPHQDI